VFSSCDNTKTPQEYLREEKKAIERYLERNKIEVLGTYPADSTFKENQYFRTSDGLYFHVTDPGRNDKVTGGTEVTVRFEYFFDVKNYIAGDTARSYLPYTYFPFVFKYGIPNSFRYGMPESFDTSFGCNGWIIPLTYVKEGAIIDVIIPSALGSQSNSNAYRPVFYKNLQYTTFK
jgi:FKBP-type peptidyl-prolyl cis-trans isomerase